jgi:nucleotide-binding universal stress UspA family protein
MKKILVPCDFSEPAQEAYKFALDLASASGGEVIVIKAIDLPLMYESAFGVQPYVLEKSLLDDLRDAATASFEKLKLKFLHVQQVHVTFKVEFGPVALAIRQCIDDYKIDLVVMGTYGAEGWKEYVFGSNTEKVVRFSTVPVIAVRAAPALASIKNIVFPTTLDFDQRPLLSKVKALQEFFGAALHVLYVNTPNDFKRDPEIQLSLKEFANYYKLSNYTLNIRNDAYEMDGIISFAEEIEADFVMMATHSRKGIMHLLSGSIAEDVVNHIGCPIWTCSLKSKTKLESSLEGGNYEEDTRSNRLLSVR